MEKAAIQRLQAIIALMVGAFTFGVYANSFESRMQRFEDSRSLDTKVLAAEIVTNQTQQVTINRNRRDIEVIETYLPATRR